MEEISLIKNLLTTIFDRYKTDMTSLHQLVEITTGDLKRCSACLFAALECPLYTISIMVREARDPENLFILWFYGGLVGDLSGQGYESFV